MRPMLLAATAFVVGGIATGAVLTQAQPAPPPVPVMGGPAQDAPPPSPMGWGGHMRPGPGGHMHPGPGIAPRDFALVYRQQDRQLAPGDVQKIAEGYLLWNGNHSWKVTDVSATPAGPIAFKLTTLEGSVVAKFTMDPHTGRVQRAG